MANVPATMTQRIILIDGRDSQAGGQRAMGVDRWTVCVVGVASPHGWSVGDKACFNSDAENAAATATGVERDIPRWMDGWRVIERVSR